MFDIKGQYMKESNTFVTNAAIKHLERDILIGTKWQFIKDSNLYI